MSNEADAVHTQALINIRNDVTDIQKKIVAQEVLVSRFDTALDKISEVSLNVSKLLAVHEQRIEAHDEIVRKHSEIISDVYDKISSTEVGLRQEMNNGQKEILVEIKSLRTDMNGLGQELKDQAGELENEIDVKFNTVNDRVSKLERLSWIVIGGATVIGFIISQALGILEFGLN